MQVNIIVDDERVHIHPRGELVAKTLHRPFVECMTKYLFLSLGTSGKIFTAW